MFIDLRGACLDTARDYAKNLPVAFLAEVERLLLSGGLGDDFRFNAVYAVALENIALRLGVDPSDPDLRNLRHF